MLPDNRLSKFLDPGLRSLYSVPRFHERHCRVQNCMDYSVTHLFNFTPTSRKWWRALKGLMPCRAIQANRHVGEWDGCLVCQYGGEDIKHIMFTCDRARKVWQSLGIRWSLCCAYCWLVYLVGASAIRTWRIDPTSL